ncbi:MAG: hypothetical protein QOE03_385 [Micromonosporaceae bacterium]|nr:hypothetical protein [Micromonosporaceae bacterium]
MTVIGSAGAKRAAFAGLIAAAVLGFSGPALAGSTPSAVAAFDAPPTAVITLEVTIINGSGCPGNSATATMLPDNSGFRVVYQDFIARDGGTAAPTEFRQNCQINVVVHIPQGFTFAIASADYRGRANLVAGASALERTNYYFQGSSANNFVDHTFTGPLHAAWHTTDVTAVAEVVFAACGVDRSLNMNTELRVNSPGGASSMSLRSSDGDVDTVVHFGWKHC